MNRKNNDIVSQLAEHRVVEHYTKVLGPDIPACAQADIAQDTYLVLLLNTHLQSIHDRGKLRDYVFTIVKNKIAKYYGKPKTVEYDDSLNGGAPTECSYGYDE